jgi:glycine cleavage system H protein
MGLGDERERERVEFPENLRYSKEHEWVALDGARARVGITDYAQDALGDVVFVQLPEVGTSVAAAASVAEVESTKSVSDIYAPVAGTVIEVNESLNDAPEQLNTDPYGTGWIFVLEASDPAAVDSLLDAAAYRRLVEEQ